MAEITIGLFVGGAGRRMGGVAKGKLLAPDGSETLIERLVRVCQQSAPSATIYLVGQSPEYDELELIALPDAPAGVGPIGGLRSLLLRAEHDSSPLAVALACDLPFIDPYVISALIAPLRTAARVPFVAGHFQPLAAAYAPSAALGAVDRALSLGKHALKQVLEQLDQDIERIELDPTLALTLRDWDTPEDVAGNAH